MLLQTIATSFDINVVDSGKHIILLLSLSLLLLFNKNNRIGNR